MKKIWTLITFLVAMANAANAQKSVQPANLTIYDSEGNWTDSYEFKYDANGNQIEETDFSSDELVGTMKRYYTYNADGKMLSVVAHKLENGKWNIQNKNIFSYNDDGSLAGECRYQWNNGTWTPFSKTELEYTEVGYTKYTYTWVDGKWEVQLKDVHGVSKNGDFSVSYIYRNGEFMMVSKSLLGYNEDGKDALRQTWDIRDGNEEKTSYGPRTSYEYDERGNLKSEIVSLLDDQGRSENNYKMEYTYDDNGRNTSIESYAWSDDQWVLDTVERYDYAETATCMSTVNSLVAKSSVRKVLANGQVNIMVDGKSYQANGMKE